MTYEQARDLIKTNPARIGYYVGFDDLTDIHNKWLIDILFRPGDQTKQAHRGSYKTSCDSLAIALNVVIRPWQRLIFLRKTDKDVQEVIRQAKAILSSGAMREICRALTNADLKLTKDSVDEIDTNLKQGIHGASQVIGYGIGSSLTGKHADTIITDDIVNIRDRISRADREKTKLIYQELQNVKNRGGRIINTGTPWHKDDAFSLMPPADKYDCYSTGLMTPEQIASTKSKMTPALFAANYELKHIADTDALFPDPKFINGAECKQLHGGICHVDAAYGGKDSTAFTIIKESYGKILVYGRLWSDHVLEHVDDIEQARKKYEAGELYMERNADKGFLTGSFSEPITTYFESMNKHLKISTYLKANWYRVYFHPDTDPLYVAQIQDYTEHAEHDDAPDSLASAIREITDGMSVQLFPGGIL